MSTIHISMVQISKVYNIYRWSEAKNKKRTIFSTVLLFPAPHIFHIWLDNRFSTIPLVIQLNWLLAIWPSCIQLRTQCRNNCLLLFANVYPMPFIRHPYPAKAASQIYKQSAPLCHISLSDSEMHSLQESHSIINYCEMPNHRPKTNIESKNYTENWWRVNFSSIFFLFSFLIIFRRISVPFAALIKI